MKVFSLAVLLFLAACASTPAIKPQFSELPPRVGLTRFYIYREKKIPGMVAKPTITIDGVDVGLLRNGGYLAFYAPAGQHEIKADFSILYAPIKGGKATITLPADEEFYLRFNIVMEALVPVRHAVYSEWETGFDVPDKQQSQALIAPLQPNNSDADVLVKGIYQTPRTTR